jgi:uncharacterized protein
MVPILGTVYKKALANSPNQKALKARQREWLNSERNPCQEPDCIRDAYLSRLTELGGGVASTVNSYSASSASFDCKKAITLVEQTICSNQELSNLDLQLATVYKKALANSPNQKALKARQQEWLNSERNPCQEPDCIRDAYLSRLTELRGSVASTAKLSISGEYQRYYRGKPDKDSATLTVRELSDGRVEIKGTAIWIGNEETGAIHDGEIEGTFARQGNQVDYQAPDLNEDSCRLTITFVENALNITNDNLRCGGLNVTFNGAYRKLRKLSPTDTTLSGPSKLNPTDTTLSGPKNCVTGKPCGNTCISVDKECHIGETPPSHSSPSHSSSGPKNCVIGKSCGNTCISVDKECHKDRPHTRKDKPHTRQSHSKGTVSVRGYRRKDGTYVKPHTRRSRSK